MTGFSYSNSKGGGTINLGADDDSLFRGTVPLSPFTTINEKRFSFRGHPRAYCGPGDEADPRFANGHLVLETLVHEDTNGFSTLLICGDARMLTSTLLDDANTKNAQISADRDAGWRLAHAASAGHGQARGVLQALAERLGGGDSDGYTSLPQALQKRLDDETSDLKSSLEAVRYEAQCLRSEVVELRGLLREQDEQIAEQKARLLIPLGREIRDAKVDQAILIARPEQWTGETLWRLTARPDASNAVLHIGAEAKKVALTPDVPGTYLLVGSCGEKRKHTLIRVPSVSTADFDPSVNEGAFDFWRRRTVHMHRVLASLLGAEPKVLDEVEDGRLLARLSEAVTVAGAPVGGGLAAWASDVRNTKLGQRAEIEELTGLLRDYRTAREHELAEFRAAADALPDALKPMNGYPYSIMCASPIQVFMTLRERALALVNPAAPAPVSGA